MAMPKVTLLAGLRRFGASAPQVDAADVRSALAAAGLPDSLVFAGQELNPDLEVLVNGRNIAFLAGLDTPLGRDDRVTVFLHGARGYPGG